jgi:hypothetical protein
MKINTYIRVTFKNLITGETGETSIFVRYIRRSKLPEPGERTRITVGYGNSVFGDKNFFEFTVSMSGMMGDLGFVNLESEDFPVCFKSEFLANWKTPSNK